MPEDAPLPSWVPEAEAKAAPMPLLLVQSFVNTWEADSGHDVLADRTTAAEWLRAAGLLLPTARLADEDLVVARGVREGLRALLVQNAGGPPPSPAALGALRALARGTWVRPILSSDGGVELEAEAGEGPALGTLLVVVRDAQRDGSWPRLKACRNDECSWAFYDRSHARRGAWCDMAVCGNRMKNRNLRSRRAGASPGPG